MTTPREYLKKRIRNKGELYQAEQWLIDNNLGWDTELSVVQERDMKAKLNHYGIANRRRAS
jgi:hypothetical protein